MRRPRLIAGVALTCIIVAGLWYGLLRPRRIERPVGVSIGTTVDEDGRILAAVHVDSMTGIDYVSIRWPATAKVKPRTFTRRGHLGTSLTRVYDVSGLDQSSKITVSVRLRGSSKTYVMGTTEYPW